MAVLKAEGHACVDYLKAMAVPLPRGDSCADYLKATVVLIT